MAPVDRDSEKAAEVVDWLSQRTGRPIRFERVEPSDEQILPDQEQRELDAVPSRLALPE
jgi:hypothetical protein